MSFGMPTCMVDLVSRGLHKFLPSSSLSELQKRTRDAKKGVNAEMSRVFKAIFGKTGIMDFDAGDGTFTFISESSMYGEDNDTANQVANFGGWLAAAAASSIQLYDNLENMGHVLGEVSKCVKGYSDSLKYEKGQSTNTAIESGLSESELGAYFDSRVAGQRKKLDKLKKQKDAIEAAESGILETLKKRALGIEEEPIFSDEIAPYLSGTDHLDQVRGNLDKLFNPATGKYQFFNPITQTWGDDIKILEKEKEIIRLVFGPPKSKQGQFLLSVDGLYYDSQTSGGIQPVLSALAGKKEELKSEELWKFEQDPNLGGRGVQISSKELENYVDTLFDPDIPDESQGLQNHYDNDHFLLTLISQKESHVLDLSANVNELELSGASTAIITNMRQSILSEIALHDIKIRKRKKQIEIAVKAPTIYQSKTKFDLGETPINDFSYLQDVNLAVDIDKQRGLILDQEDVTGVVLPLTSKFVVNPGNEHYTTVDHLLVPEVGTGGFLTTDSSVHSASGTTLNITSPIITDDLIAVYNFLNSKVETAPSSTNYNVLNCASPDMRNNAQLVAPDASSVFTSGLGMVYLKGIAKLKTVTSYSESADISALGNYVRLPDTNEFQDWTYSRKGFTFETWTHIPTLSSVKDWSNDVSAQYRLLLSCENTGIVSSVSAQNDVNRLVPDFGDSITRGMMIGFTSDKRISLGEEHTNFRVDAKSSINLPASSMAFFMAPTQSKNASSVGFMNKGKDGTCASGPGWYGLSMNVSTAGENSTTFNGVCSSFMLITVSVDVLEDKVSIYLNGNLMTTAGINAVFGVPERSPINLPSSRRENSFEYSSSTVNTDAPETLKTGPHIYNHRREGLGFFTPWIIGGGWTDGMVRNPGTGVSVGNFMGENYGGFRSGLDGFIGSTKFYKKPLSQAEAKNNYNGQKYFFENIKIIA